MNMTELAVEKSPRSTETETAVASSTATESLPCSSAFSPSWIYFSERTIAIAVVTGTGRNSFDAVRRSTAIASLSSNSRFSSRVVCSGTSCIASAAGNENAASAFITAARSAQ